MRSLYANIGFDPEKDFDPISLIGTQANMLVVNPNVPAHTMAELIDLAKANPGKLNFASSGYGLRRISPANCSRPWRISTSCMCPIKARRRPCRTSLPGKTR